MPTQGKFGEGRLRTPGGTVTWSFGDPDGFNRFTATIQDPGRRKMIAEAFDVWASVLNISFRKVNGDADIELGWRPIDGRGGTLGNARTDFIDDLRIERAAVRFDTGEDFSTDPDYEPRDVDWYTSRGVDILIAIQRVNANPPQADFLTVAIHEIGHAIGILEHLDDPATLMAASAGSRTLTDADIAAGAAIYGRRGDAPAGRRLEGDDGPNKLRGGSGDDTVIGRRGDDRLFGGRGEDSVDGGRGDDFVKGGYGYDRLFGGAGEDRVVGNSGNDRILGRADDDWLYGGKGRDAMFGGRGDDRLYGGDLGDRLAGGRGDDRLAGNGGQDRLAGGLGDDRIGGGGGHDRMRGQAGDDRMNGGDGRDVMRGGAGADRLNGGRHDDYLDGGRGPDRLNGGDGDDRVKGGGGADVFLLDPRSGRDRALDFEVGVDRLEVSANPGDRWVLSQRDEGYLVGIRGASMLFEGVTLGDGPRPFDVLFDPSLDWQG